VSGLSLCGNVCECVNIGANRCVSIAMKQMNKKKKKSAISPILDGGASCYAVDRPTEREMQRETGRVWEGVIQQQQDEDDADAEILKAPGARHRRTLSATACHQRRCRPP